MSISPFNNGAGTIDFASMVKDAPDLDCDELIGPFSTKFNDINRNINMKWFKSDASRVKETY